MTGYDADIRWTSYGVPHIRAATLDSLAFGVGYAYARDNAELLADAVLTVRGARSLHFGPSAQTRHPPLSNLDSDIFHRACFDPAALKRLYENREPLAASMLGAYAAGVALQLQKALDQLEPPYQQALSTAPITATDLYLLLARQAAETSGCAFAGAIAAAQPPNDGDKDKDPDDVAKGRQTAGPMLGSNAFALGRDLTGNGSGLLVGNPHFPWFGPHRLFQMHLTVPGELDVMGASLPPFPVINIGFNADVAWTHTVSPSRRYAVHELSLSRHSPLAYRVGSRIEEMSRRTLSIPVQEADGRVGERRRTVYASRHGPLIAMPAMGCRWSRKRAYALQDMAAGRTGMLSQWLALNKARSVTEIHQALSTHRGALWLTTLAADRAGEVYCGDLSAVPDVPWRDRLRRAPSLGARILAQRQKLIVLNGAKDEPARASPDRPLAGLRPASEMPAHVRSDYVLNCNDAVWLSNAEAPLAGYPGFVGPTRAPQGLRTRMAHIEMAALKARGAPIDAQAFKDVLFSNRNYAAAIVLDDLLRLGTSRNTIAAPGQDPVDLQPAFAALAEWNRRDDPDAAGAVLFREFWRRAQGIRRLWSTRFSARAPLSTPCGLAINKPGVADALLATLAAAVRTLEDCGLPPDAKLRTVQRIIVDGEAIPIPGGHGAAGILNLVDFGVLTPQGYSAAAVQGTSYTQLVRWSGGRVVAEAILPFSQASDPSSPHAWDQTRLFSRGEWIRLPFYEEEILADPNLTSIHVSHTPSPAHADGPRAAAAPIEHPIQEATP